MSSYSGQAKFPSRQGPPRANGIYQDSELWAGGFSRAGTGSAGDFWARVLPQASQTHSHRTTGARPPFWMPANWNRATWPQLGHRAHRTWSPVADCPCPGMVLAGVAKVFTPIRALPPVAGIHEGRRSL